MSKTHLELMEQRAPRKSHRSKWQAEGAQQSYTDLGPTYRPLNVGDRFSLKAAVPSRPSSEKAVTAEAKP